MSVVLEFSVNGKQPIPFKRAGRNGKYTYTPPDMAKWEATVSEAAQEAGATPLAGDMAIELTFRREKRNRADLDNLSKCVLDALNGVAYVDDKQVIQLIASVEYGCSCPGVDVVLRRAA